VNPEQGIKFAKNLSNKTAKQQKKQSAFSLKQSVVYNSKA